MLHMHVAGTDFISYNFCVKQDLENKISSPLPGIMLNELFKSIKLLAETAKNTVLCD